MPVELTSADKATLADLLRDTMPASRFPLSPCIRKLKVTDSRGAGPAELGAVRPTWLSNLTSADINVTVYPSSRIIDHFRFFNGLGAETVAKMIDTILVPDHAAKIYVRQFVRQNAALFKGNTPRIRLFPSTVLRRLVWSIGRLLKTRIR